MFRANQRYGYLDSCHALYIWNRPCFFVLVGLFWAWYKKLEKIIFHTLSVTAAVAEVSSHLSTITVLTAQLLFISWIQLASAFKDILQDGFGRPPEAPCRLTTAVFVLFYPQLLSPSPLALHRPHYLSLSLSSRPGAVTRLRKLNRRRQHHLTAPCCQCVQQEAMSVQQGPCCGSGSVMFSVEQVRRRSSTQTSRTSVWRTA